MRRSLGLVDSDIGGLLDVPEAAFGREVRDGWDVSWIWKDRQTVGQEVGKGEGGDGEEEGDTDGEAVGVGVRESPSVCSRSSFGKGVRGGTSSTSTSE